MRHNDNDMFDSVAPNGNHIGVMDERNNPHGFEVDERLSEQCCDHL